MSIKFTVTAPKPSTYRRIREAVTKQVARALAEATDETVKQTKADIRAAMEQTKLGKLSRAIDYTSDLKKRRVPQAVGNPRFRVGGIVFSKDGGGERVAGALEAYTSGQVTILPKRGRWLAIASREIPNRAGRYRMTPKLYRDKGFEKRIGPLQFITTDNPRVALLVVKNVQVNAARGFGRAERIPGTGRIRPGKVAKKQIVAFVLIRITRRAERLNPELLFARQTAQLDDRIQARLRGRTVGGAGQVTATWLK